MTFSAPKHFRILGAISVALGLASAGCATQPRVMAPTVMALPAKGEDFALFQQHDQTCRQYAAAMTSGRPPGQVAGAGAAVGAGVGAASGALIGSATGHAGAGAAIGAGTGLFMGAAVGASSRRRAAVRAQYQYNMGYTQCMVGNGEQIVPRSGSDRAVSPPPVIYAPGPPPPPAPPLGP
jgi:hypothetical protein